MKTKILVRIAAFFITCFSVIQARAQFIFDNQTNCSVEITYEEGTYQLGPPAGCQVCNWGTTTVAPGGQFTFSTCGSDICIIIVSVGGNPVNWYNHANYLGGAPFGCHPTMPPGSWTTGQSSTVQCSVGWSTSWSGTTLIIN